MTADEFRAVVIAANGHRENICAATGLTLNAINRRLANNPDLREAYPMPKSRGASNLDSVTRDDLETYRAALRVYGVSDNHLTKLAALDGLTTDGDRLLAVSFRVSHQSYVGQLHNLDEVADAIKERLRGTEMPDGTFQPLEPEAHAALAKVYMDCVKERGRGMSTIMTGIEAIHRMTAAAREDDPAAGRVKPGWGKMKKVRPA